MTDPRLNSVHLPAPRRQDFRSARSALLGACGPATLAGDWPPGDGPVVDSPTAIQNLGAPARTEARFVLVDGDFTYPLKVGLNTLGRLPDNDVVIRDPYVSRRHCAILVHAHGNCELHDIASKNGTLINGQSLKGPTRLSSGDQILLCERRLTFVARDDLPSPSDRHPTLSE
jgi:pSer/pThr/pTyr-binding forkhead associated (FHA) protein